jgi:hypothetical protein
MTSRTECDEQKIPIFEDPLSFHPPRHIKRSNQRTLSKLDRKLTQNDQISTAHYHTPTENLSSPLLLYVSLTI